jgi:hypothetical protein
MLYANPPAIAVSSTGQPERQHERDADSPALCALQSAAASGRGRGELGARAIP